MNTTAAILAPADGEHSVIIGDDIIPAARVRPTDIAQLAADPEGLLQIQGWTADELVGLSPWALAAYAQAVGKEYAVDFLDYMQVEEQRGRLSDDERKTFWPLNDAIYGHKATHFVASLDCSSADLIEWAADRTAQAWAHHIGGDLDLADALAAAYSDLAERIGDPLGQLKAAQQDIERLALAIERQRAEAADMGKLDSVADDGEHYATTVQLTSAASIQPEPIKWLWDGYLAQGKLILLAGPAGVSKTTVSMLLAAILTRAGIWPDGSRAPLGDVLIWSGEDDPADTLVPRLLAAGADLERVQFITGTAEEGGEHRPFDPATDMPALRRAMAGGRFKLLIVDPIVSAVSGDSHKNTEVRRNLQPLVDLAAATGVCVLGITHFSKGTQGRDPLERVTGSIAFGALARVVIACGKDGSEDAGDHDRLFVRTKSNIGPDGGGFRYAVEQVAVPGHLGLYASRCTWGDSLEGSARDILAQAESVADPEERDALADAMSFLRGLLADGPVGAKTVRTDGDAAGHAWRTLHRAADRLGVERHKEGMRGGWVWKLAPKMPSNPEDATKPRQENVAPSRHLGTFSDNSPPASSSRISLEIEYLDGEVEL